ncbi:MAG: hypothetical protein LJE92_14895 [Gammaproteobacteria bacterium]|jgi:hypothetical protein|nr:hypothetical protein [Gammaproteobacteria bacterium]
MKYKNLLIYHGFPLFIMVFPFIWVALAGNDRALKGELGMVELGTFFFLVIAIGLCISSLTVIRRLEPSVYLKAWIVILIIGATYFALEEVSYGQHVFHWRTAEAWKALNDQNETNLHNVHALFDQVPRALLTIGILVGGVVLPLYRYFRGIKLEESNRFYWQWPTMDCVTIGLLVILIRPFQMVVHTHVISTGETKEMLFALFILLYCLSLHSRLRQKAVIDSPAAARHD